MQGFYFSKCVYFYWISFVHELLLRVLIVERPFVWWMRNCCENLIVKWDIEGSPYWNKAEWDRFNRSSSIYVLQNCQDQRRTIANIYNHVYWICLERVSVHYIIVHRQKVSAGKSVLSYQTNNYISVRVENLSEAIVAGWLSLNNKAVCGCWMPYEV